MENKYAFFEPDGIYHVYNRANGDEKIFLSNENYSFFLRKYEKYIPPLAETLRYCLMPNHFHFLIKIKNEEALKEQFELKALPKEEDLPGFQNLAGLNNKKLSNYISKQFSNLFNSYTKAFNKMYHRKGTLFMKPFRRKKVEDEAYLKKLVHYIHYNPVESGMAKTPMDWKYSSFQAIISSKQSLVCRNQVIAFFEDQENFIFYHKTSPFINGIN